jgi:hypothetical protein
MVNKKYWPIRNIPEDLPGQVQVAVIESKGKYKNAGEFVTVAIKNQIKREKEQK